MKKLSKDIKGNIVIAIIIVLIVIANFCQKCYGQVSFNLSGGTSYSDEINYFVGTELQGSNVSVTASWHPQVIEKYFYVNGFSLKATYYLWAYQTTPYFSMGVVTHGNYKHDEMTGKAFRSMPIVVGFRIYPNDYNDNILEDLSFDIGAGIELAKYRPYPYVELTMNFALAKYK
jgi:hypothetical protein